MSDLSVFLTMTRGAWKRSSIRLWRGRPEPNWGRRWQSVWRWRQQREQLGQYLSSEFLPAGFVFAKYSVGFHLHIGLYFENWENGIFPMDLMRWLTECSGGKKRFIGLHHVFYIVCGSSYIVMFFQRLCKTKPKKACKVEILSFYHFWHLTLATLKSLMKVNQFSLVWI